LEKAVIGGTGVYDLSDKNESRTVQTEYGKAEVDIVEFAGEKIVFLARHGRDHSKPPHQINYKANMKALQKLGVKYVYATAAVGSCNENYGPGEIVVVNDFLDFTKGRQLTFFEGEDMPVKHFDMSDPYCSNLRSEFNNTAEDKGLKIAGSGVYVCTEGPRFETAAEIRMFQQLGGDIVGMTGVPEVVLAKELGICYSSVAIITNWCTGMKAEVSGHEIKSSLADNKEKITEVFMNIFNGDLDQKHCRCTEAAINV